MPEGLDDDAKAHAPPPALMRGDHMAIAAGSATDSK